MIWQTLDADGHRGIVAFAEVLADPQVRQDEFNQYWINEEDRSATYARVPLRYILPNNVPIWIHDGPISHVLEGLSVARAQGGTVFNVTVAQWQLLSDYVDLKLPGPEEIEASQKSRHRNTKATGQGFGLTPSERRVVECYAMDAAIRFLKQYWDVVRDVSSNSSYDLHCARKDDELRVEVKGTTSTGERVVLTKNEVRESADGSYALFVLSEICLDRSNPKSPTVNGGVARYYNPLLLGNDKLTPISYTCELDLEKSLNVTDEAMDP